MMRYAEVSRDGVFKVKGDLRILYSVMLATRVNMICMMNRFLAPALTICTRYAAVRR